MALFATIVIVGLIVVAAAFIIFEPPAKTPAVQDFIAKLEKGDVALSDLAPGLNLLRVQAEAIGGPERSRVYKAALRILERHPESTEARVFALEVGRFYYSYDRKGGVPTVYDEAAIANDIAARSGK